ncbi:amidase signature enzyme [Cadophora sp. DSE1049]|nr:amidase signature enzyme [Cadophora sp. DSE1049]
MPNHHRLLGHCPHHPHHVAKSIWPPPYVTVIPLSPDFTDVEAEWLKSTIAQYLKLDGVFGVHFLSGVIFTGSPKVNISPDAHVLLQNLGNTWIEVDGDATPASNPPAGLYCVVNEELHHLRKLYEDTQGAFLTALVPGGNGQTSQFQIAGGTLKTVAVAVPSRLQGREVSNRPLQGWRIAVKDIFRIEGIKTSVCNRAFFELYPPATQTAACVEILEQKGACILGTTKLASFAATEEPIECVDYQAPWNPRADGYQSPAGSSSGSGVAVASYAWVDIAIGSDTSGSGRRPGHWNGCFAHRPSHGVLPTEGYIPSFEQFDTPTFFGRSLGICREFTEHWYGDKLQQDPCSLPPAIVYPTEFMSMITNKDQLKIINDFTEDLENSLNVKHEKVSFGEVWSSDPPAEAEGASLQDFMKYAGRNSFFHDDYHHFDEFRTEYHQVFNKTPYVSPPVRWQWNLAAGITQEERDEAVHRLSVYEKWCSEKILKIGTKSTILLIPIENMTPRYRDEPLGRYFNPVGIPMLFVAPILKAPEFTVPIGEVPFLSRVTGNSEKLPVAISLLGAPGRDLELMDIARECLEMAGRPTSVLHGTKLFPE